MIKKKTSKISNFISDQKTLVFCPPHPKHEEYKLLPSIEQYKPNPGTCGISSFLSTISIQKFIIFLSRKGTFPSNNAFFFSNRCAYCF
jgi:hypothetical protein